MGDTVKMDWIALRDQLEPLVVLIVGPPHYGQSKQIAGEMVSCIRGYREFPFSKYSLSPGHEAGIVAVIAGARAAILAAKAG